MAFLDIINEVVKLSKLRQTEENLIAAKYGFQMGVSLPNPNMGKYLQEPRPARDVLKRYLESLSDFDVEKLQTLMYAGRDKEDIRELHRYLKDNTVDKDDAIRTIMGKGSLHIDLEEGLKVAASQEVNLDASF